MLVSTVDVIPNRKYELIGMVSGGVVLTRNIGSDIAASFKTLIGGELKGYEKMLKEARERAADLMVNDATALGASAIIGVLYSTSSIMQGAAECFAYGTAIKFID